MKTYSTFKEQSKILYSEETEIKYSNTKGDNNERSNEIKNGYGSCKSCNCKGWIPNNPKNDYCKNCGHHWERHW